MDNRLVFLLAEAAASLDAAMEACESGSPEWALILDAKNKVEKLVAYEVNTTWPAADDDH